MRYSSQLAVSLTLILLLFGCGQSASDAISSSPSPESESVDRGQASGDEPPSVERFCQSREHVPSRTILSGNRVDELEDWFRLGDQVVEVTVLKERVGPRLIEDERGPKVLHARDLLLRVERILYGSMKPGQEVWIRSMASLWADSKGNPLPDSKQGCALLMPENRALVALQGDGTSPDITETGLVNPDSAVILRGSEVLDTPRREGNSVIKQLESVSATQAVTMLRQARDRALESPPLSASPVAPQRNPSATQTP